IATATERARRPLRGQARIALRVGKVLGRRKVGKHFTLEITDTRFRAACDEAAIAREAALDGIYVLRTSVEADRLPTAEAVRSYSRLLRDLRTIVKNRIRLKAHPAIEFDKTTTPTPLQQRALDRLGASLIV